MYLYSLEVRSLLEPPFFLFNVLLQYIPEKNNTVVTVPLSEGYF